MSPTILKNFRAALTATVLAGLLPATASAGLGDLVHRVKQALGGKTQAEKCAETVTAPAEAPPTRDELSLSGIDMRQVDFAIASSTQFVVTSDPVIFNYMKFKVAEKRDGVLININVKQSTEYANGIPNLYKEIYRQLVRATEHREVTIDPNDDGAARAYVQSYLASGKVFAVAVRCHRDLYNTARDGRWYETTVQTPLIDMAKQHHIAIVALMSRPADFQNPRLPMTLVGKILPVAIPERLAGKLDKTLADQLANYRYGQQLTLSLSAQGDGGILKAELKKIQLALGSLDLQSETLATSPLQLVVWVKIWNMADRNFLVEQLARPDYAYLFDYHLNSAD